MWNIPRLLEELANTPSFRRIRKVSFLGIVDYSNQYRGGARRVYSRAEHSMGVMQLGLNALRHMQANEADAAHLVAACMVHDLGHPPFSHSLEYAFPKHARNITHHEALKRILLAPKGPERAVCRVLEGHNIDPMRIFSIVDGSDKLSFLFNAPVNIDTIDGISRSMESFGIFRTYDIVYLSEIVGKLYSGVEISSSVDIMEMDKFWQNKGLFYGVLSSENMLSLAERRFQHVVRRHIRELTYEYFRMTDRDFMARHPEIMHDFVTLVGPEEIENHQNFVINKLVRRVDRSSVYSRYVRIKDENRSNRAFAS